MENFLNSIILELDECMVIVMDVRIRIRFENGASYIERKHSDVIVHFLLSSVCNGFT